MNRLIIRFYELLEVDDVSSVSPVDRNAEIDLTGKQENEEISFGALSPLCDWAIVDEKGALLAFHQNYNVDVLIDSLSTDGIKYSDVIVCPPMEKLHIRRLTLAAGQRKHLEKVAPFLMEEGLSQATDELHFTVLSKEQKDSAWVAVVETRLMSLWTQQLAGWNIKAPIILPLSSAFMALKSENPLLASINTSDREESASWLWIAEDAVHCLPESMLAYLPKQEISLYASESQVTALASSLDGVMPPQKTYSATAEIHALERMSDFILQNKTWREKNLCHSDFRQGGIWLEKLTPWRWVAACAVIAFFLELFLMQASTKALEMQEQDVREKSNALFLQLVPSEGRVVNLSRQLRGLLQQSPSGKSTQQTDTVYDVLAKIDQAREQVKGSHRLTKLDYFDQTYRLDWVSEQRETLDEIREALSNKLSDKLSEKSLTVLLEQVVRQESGYRASFKIQIEG
ncbi:type II secretion system protein GspL [Marinomonas sp. 2405UD68-3]|uniref:type II secretion system protein GspL n=1 Tax=Marinomonas sp. 2405UD68-3 TaxID=3391835 RepID=UPI0039C8C32C